MHLPSTDNISYKNILLQLNTVNYKATKQMLKVINTLE